MCGVTLVYAKSIHHPLPSLPPPHRVRENYVHNEDLQPSTMVWWARFTCFTFYRIMLPIPRSISWSISLYFQCSLYPFISVYESYISYRRKKKRNISCMQILIANICLEKKIYWSLEIFEYNYLRKRGFNFVKFTL